MNCLCSFGTFHNKIVQIFNYVSLIELKFAVLPFHRFPVFCNAEFLL